MHPKWFAPIVAFALALFLLLLSSHAPSVPLNIAHAAPAYQGPPEPLPTPEPIPTPEVPGEVVVDLVPHTSQIEAGDFVTYTVALTNTTDAALTAVVISGTIPPSTTFVADGTSPVTYDPDRGSLTWNAGEVGADTVLTATYRLQAQETLADTQVVAGIEATSPDLTETLDGWDVIDVGTPPTDTKWITPEGGGFTAGTTPVTVFVPTDVLTQPLQFKAEPFSGTLSAEMWNAFEFTARTENNELVSTFPGSITVAINLRDHWEAVKSTAGTPTIYWLNESSGEWEIIPSDMEWATGVVSAKVTHFSGYGSGSSTNGSYGVEHLPTLGRFSTDEWGGNSSVNYSFALPPAPGNMPFGLSLNYSSEGVNALFAMNKNNLNDPNSALNEYARQAGVAGWGWNLGGLGSVNPINMDRAMIRAGSVSAEVVWRDDGLSNGTWDWQTDPQQFVQIHSMAGSGDQRNPQRTTKWELFTQDGTRYTFGGDSFGSSAVAYNRKVYGGPYGGCPGLSYFEERTRELYLSEIRDVHGNRIVIDYEREMKDWNNGCGNNLNYVHAVRPIRISYFPATVGSSTAEIEFKYSTNREDYGVLNYNNIAVQALYTRHRLEAIEIRIRTATGLEEAQKYTFGYDQVSFGTSGQPYKQLLRLIEIRELGQDWDNGLVPPYTLPAYTFEYTKFDNDWLNTTVLSKAHNGQGGRVEYDYIQSGDFDIWGCITESPQERAYRYYVSETRTYDGLGTLPVQKVIYHSTYGYVHAAASGDPTCADEFEFGGYATVTKSILDGTTGTAVQRVINDYYTGGGNGVEARAGKLALSRTFDPAWTLLTVTDPMWAEGSAYSSPWVYLQESTSTIKGTTTPYTPDVIKRTVYDYDIANQPGNQFGLQTHVWEYINGGTTPVRHSETWYMRNLTQYQILPRATRTYDGAGTCTGTTRYGYDGLGYISTATYTGTKGELTDIWTATTDCLSTHTVAANGWLRTQTDYDDWGNTTITTDPRGNTTTTTYDTSGSWPKLYAYPIAVNAPLSINTTLTWNKYLGQVEVATDANGAQTNYLYDEFGRLEKMWKPGDTSTAPTQALSYYNYYGPLMRPYMALSVQKMNGGSETYNTTQSAVFYDGLGREVQTRSFHYDTISSGLEWVITLNRYHALGGVSESYAPISVTPDSDTLRFYEYGDTTANWSVKTTTTYDALGRVLTMTDPSGAVTSHSYGTESVSGVAMTKHAVMDANRHRTRYRTDALGRMHSIVEQTGNCGSYETGYSCTAPYNVPWADYATTTYSYNSRDQLTEVAHSPIIPGASAFTMSYDLAGRKTAMSDPDMGAWQYVYDNAGNLIRQRDAQQNGICIEYDSLNRETRRVAYEGLANLNGIAYVNGVCPIWSYSRYEVLSFYDNDPNYSFDKGRRWKVEVNHFAESNRDSHNEWRYDARGRVTEDITVIGYNSTNYAFRFRYTYDAADRLRSVQYPSDAAYNLGETVTYDYTDAKHLLLRGINGDNPYLSNRQYNHYGQITQQTYGTSPSAIQTTAYWPLTTPNGQGRVQSISTAVGFNYRQNLHYYDINAPSQPGYDAVGNLRYIIDAVNSSNPQIQAMQYDELDRLKRYEVTGGTGGTWGAQWFEYDTVGNLTYIKNNNASGTVQRAYNNGAQRSATYCSVGGLNPAHAATARTDYPGTIVTDYCYDDVGNMVERQTGSVEETLLYDMENRLTHHYNNTGTINATFAYNGDGARVRSTINGVTTLYAGLIEYEIDGSTTTLTKYYDAGGQRVAVRNGTSLNFLLNDHLGSTSVMLKTNGSLWGELRYSAWGETRYSNGTIVTDRQYTGQINDGDTGLYYYNARYYDPALHRFIQADTIVPDPNDPQTLNRYSYVNNNPVNFSDPSGNCAAEAENDPEHQDYACWQKIWEIQDIYQNVYIRPDNWTLFELELLLEVLVNHLYASDIAKAEFIGIGRESKSVRDDGTSLIGGEVVDDGEGVYYMAIYDDAFLIEPDVNSNAGLGDFLINFKGTIYHELMHVVAGENPNIQRQYNALVVKYGPPPVGSQYKCDGCDMEEEMLAMTTSTFAYKPEVLVGTNWSSKWPSWRTVLRKK